MLRSNPSAQTVADATRGASQSEMSLASTPCIGANAINLYGLAAVEKRSYFSTGRTYVYITWGYSRFAPFGDILQLAQLTI